MRHVFIGGSRHLSRLNASIRERLDNIVERSLNVLIGDANGADRAVQQYLQDRGYRKVHVFCVEGRCRNNVGGWPVEEVPVPKGLRGAELYTVKDRAMTDRSECGLMLWDGKSSGTLANIVRLIEQQKPVVVYQANTREFKTLKSRSELDAFLDQHAPHAERVLFR
jgi:hypothetical protein